MTLGGIGVPYGAPKYDANAYLAITDQRELPIMRPTRTATKRLCECPGEGLTRVGFATFGFLQHRREPRMRS